MQLQCLGTTGFHPSPSRHTACYYLPELSILLDAGTGVFRLVPELLREPKKSLKILLSHAHLDHTVGLTFLIDALAVTELEEITLIGDPEKLNVIKEHLYQELLFPVDPRMEFVELPAIRGKMAVGDVDVEWFPLEHPGGALGYVLETQNKKLAYVTDTVARMDAEYLPKIANADLLLHECYFADENEQLAIKTGHSWLSAVTDVVRSSKPNQTALIHINPLAEILGNGFELSDEHHDLNMFIAEDEMSVDF